MAAATYQTPIINTQDKRTAAYTGAIVILEHLKAQTGGYNLDLVSLDFSVTAANRITFTTTGPLPASQLSDRFPGITQIA
jgi:hypothetical protein